MFSSSIVWAVGGIASVSSSAQLRVLVEDVVELALEPAELLLGQSEAGEIRDVLDVGAGQVAMRPMILARAAPAPAMACSQRWARQRRFAP